MTDKSCTGRDLEGKDHCPVEILARNLLEGLRKRRANISFGTVSV
jgi:hypothetical protein